MLFGAKGKQTREIFVHDHLVSTEICLEKT